MKFSVKEFSRFGTMQAITVKLTERLPDAIQAPCTVNCMLMINRVDNYYLLNLETNAELNIECQRCLKLFKYDYHHKDELALCLHEDRANTLMELYDVVVLENQEFNLIDIITDNLHLYAPWAHEESCLN